MHYHRLTTLIVLAALIIPLGAVVAQDGGLSDGEQSLVERVRTAIIATEEYPAGLVLIAANSTNDAEIVLGENTYPGVTATMRESEHRFTRDAEGLPNSAVLSTIDVSETDANGNVRDYQLTTEVRTVGGAVYVQATRDSEDEGALDPMPEGWLWVDDTTADQWPALDEIPLNDALREVDQLGVVDPDVLIMLDHASSAALGDPIALDDGVKVEVVRVALTGDDLIAALTVVAERSGLQSGPAYALLDPASTWEMTFYLDAADNLLRLDMDVTIILVDVDLAVLSPGAPEGSRFSTRQSFTISYVISVFDAPTEPVSAPEIAASE